jgi:hypothetical protein
LPPTPANYPCHLGFLPDLARFDRSQRVQALEVTEDAAAFELSRHDAAAQ